MLRGVRTRRHCTPTPHKLTSPSWQPDLGFRHRVSACNSRRGDASVLGDSRRGSTKPVVSVQLGAEALRGSRRWQLGLISQANWTRLPGPQPQWQAHDGPHKAGREGSNPSTATTRGDLAAAAPPQEAARGAIPCPRTDRSPKPGGPRRNPYRDAASRFNSGAVDAGLVLWRGHRLDTPGSRSSILRSHTK